MQIQPQPEASSAAYKSKPGRHIYVLKAIKLLLERWLDPKSPDGGQALQGGIQVRVDGASCCKIPKS